MTEKPIDAHAEILDFIAKCENVEKHGENYWIKGPAFEFCVGEGNDGRFRVGHISIRGAVNTNEESISIFLESLRLADLL